MAAGDVGFGIVSLNVSTLDPGRRLVSIKQYFHGESTFRTDDRADLIATCLARSIACDRLV
jgi:hypothetical protein